MFSNKWTRKCSTMKAKRKVEMGVCGLFLLQPKTTSPDTYVPKKRPKKKPFNLLYPSKNCLNNLNIFAQCFTLKTYIKFVPFGLMGCDIYFLLVSCFPHLLHALSASYSRFALWVSFLQCLPLLS